MKRLLISLMTVGCGGPRTEKVSEEVSIDDYTMFNETDLSWTYRDDGQTETSPENTQLLRARIADGLFDFRRGGRWADGVREAAIAYTQTDRLVVSAWQWEGSMGQGNFPLSKSNSKEGDKVAEGAWVCTDERPDVVETYYGAFSDVLTFSCSGGSGPEGDWHFAKDVGLIAFDSEGYQLDLVAPW
tara:strand:+ start:131 stop:688 length:558 start_codon:yes stop_codon:yes gene_type:complete